jgi:ABC-type transport system substrate-binding protein
VHEPLQERQPETQEAIVPELGLQYVGFRADRPPFANELVRKAFSHATDRELFVHARQDTTLARAATRGGAIPPAMPAHSHRVGPDYDLQLARELLAQAGYPDGNGLPELELVAPQALEAQPLAEQWRALGARVRIRTTRDHIEIGDLEGSHLWVSGWTADYPDPDGFFRGLMRIGMPFYLDEEIAELLQQARSLQNQGERMRLYHEIDHLWVAEHAAILPLAYSRALLLWRPWIERLWANPLSRAHLDEVVVVREREEEPSSVELPDEPEPFEREERIDAFDRL